ncbi:unnamed protein product [Fusarium graminearum]|nr:unnamed protein product [Fusarium graminearum]
MSRETYSQHDGIAGLVGSKAFEIWVAHGILDTGTEGKKQKLDFEEEIDFETGRKVMADIAW